MHTASSLWKEEVQLLTSARTAAILSSVSLPAINPEGAISFFMVAAWSILEPKIVEKLLISSQPICLRNFSTGKVQISWSKMIARLELILQQDRSKSRKDLLVWSTTAESTASSWIQHSLIKKDKGSHGISQDEKQHALKVYIRWRA